jgi:toxin ParE1/3/4
MKKRVYRADQATEDLVGIWTYVALDDVRAADGLIDRIGARSERLARFPKSGRARDELLPELRSVAVGAYVIFYREVDDGIEILRVLHGSRDVDTLW